MRTKPVQEFTVLLRNKKKGPFSEALQIVESAGIEPASKQAIKRLSTCLVFY
jgi:hypothetical protein